MPRRRPHIPPALAVHFELDDPNAANPRAAVAVEIYGRRLGPDHLDEIREIAALASHELARLALSLGDEPAGRA